MEDALAQEENLSHSGYCWVLILVVMEDALARVSVSILTRCAAVLILVVMEDALALYYRISKSKKLLAGLNPCCNGRCTRTSINMIKKEIKKASLNPCCNGRCTRTE